MPNDYEFVADGLLVCTWLWIGRCPAMVCQYQMTPSPKDLQVLLACRNMLGTRNGHGHYSSDALDLPHAPFNGYHMHQEAVGDNDKNNAKRRYLSYIKYTKVWAEVSGNQIRLAADKS